VAPDRSATAARRAAAADSLTAQQNRLARDGRAEPLNRRADLNATFGIYSQMVYNRGALMYSALRDVLGEAPFAAFLRDYYARWAYRHVDDAAMRASAERAAGADTPGGRDLGWFFAQWLGQVGTIDYAMRGARVTPPAAARGGAGCWRTEVTLVRAGTYRHPMPVGIRTASGWAVVRGDPRRDRETLVRFTPAAPFEVRLDPFRTTEAVATEAYTWRPAHADSVPEPRPREVRDDLPAYASAAACVAAQRSARAGDAR
jgi:aminopeptidase N